MLSLLFFGLGAAGEEPIGWIADNRRQDLFESAQPGLFQILALMHFRSYLDSTLAPIMQAERIYELHRLVCPSENFDSTLITGTIGSILLTCL